MHGATSTTHLKTWWESEPTKLPAGSMDEDYFTMAAPEPRAVPGMQSWGKAG